MGSSENHLPVVAWLNIAMGIFWAISIIFALGIILLALGVVGGISSLGSSVIVVFILLFVMIMFAGPGLVGGIMLLKGIKASKVLLLIASAINLFYFPVGTVLAIYTFWALLSDDAADYFKRPDRLKDLIAEK